MPPENWHGGCDSIGPPFGRDFLQEIESTREFQRKAEQRDCKVRGKKGKKECVFQRSHNDLENEMGFCKNHHTPAEVLVCHESQC